MSNIHRLLPKLTLNRVFLHDLMAANPPCFALGYLEERDTMCGFLAIRPENPIPFASTQQGFRLGHSVIGSENSPVLHFAFEFYDYALYQGLLNPSNPIVKSVLTRMVDTKDYFIFVINSDQSVVSFRSQFEHSDLVGLKTNLNHFGDTHCTDKKFEQIYQAFKANNHPHQCVLNWVCRDNLDYLNLTQHRFEVKPKQI